MSRSIVTVEANRILHPSANLSFVLPGGHFIFFLHSPTSGVFRRLLTRVAQAEVSDEVPLTVLLLELKGCLLFKLLVDESVILPGIFSVYTLMFLDFAYTSL
jgi:hypothetical protein